MENASDSIVHEPQEQKLMSLKNGSLVRHVAAERICKMPDTQGQIMALALRPCSIKRSVTMPLPGEKGTPVAKLQLSQEKGRYRKQVADRVDGKRIQPRSPD